MWRLFIALAVTLFALPARGLPVPAEVAGTFERRVEDGHLAEDTDKAIGKMIALAAKTLRAEAKGFGSEQDDYAAEITREWETKYQGFLLMRGMGDHAPVEWMRATWAKLDSLLGHTAMAATHLDDLWVFAYSIPVVFWCEDKVDAKEYGAHFTGTPARHGFLPKVAWWTFYIGCEIACFAGGFTAPVSLLCSPGAWVTEGVTFLYIAPRLSPRVWRRVCGGP